MASGPSSSGAASSSSWLDSALASAGIGDAVSSSSLTGVSAATTLDTAAARLGADSPLAGWLDAFRSTLTWTGAVAIGAELLLGLSLLVFLVWLVRKGALEIFG